MPTRNVVLTEVQANFVQEMVASGQYQNACEVLREGLRLVQTREAEQAAKLVALRPQANGGGASPTCEAGAVIRSSMICHLEYDRTVNAISKRVLAKHG